MATRTKRGVFIAAGLTVLLANGASAVPINPVLENVLPAFLSFDAASALLGLHAGIDPTFPTITANGHIEATGFDWSTSATYNGLPLSWTASGIYDAMAHATHWTGSGSYNGQAWSMEGDVEWTSDTSFRTRDSISINSTLVLSTTDGSGHPLWNAGTFTDPPTSITYEEISSSHWYWPPSWGAKDGLKVTIDTDGKVVEDTYTLTKTGTTVGGGAVKVGPATAGGGFINFGGGTYAKTIKISAIPEPSAWLMSLVGMGLVMGWSGRRKKAHAL